MGEVKRPLPLLTDANREFWEAGKDGKLKIAHCQQCGFYIHPVLPNCPKCLSFDVKFDEVSGKGRLLSYTINHHPWVPNQPVPYIVAIVELQEQSGLHLTTNMVECEASDLQFDMPVEVVFEPCEDVFLPLFRPLK